MSHRNSIGVIASSSAVPLVELDGGVERLREAGFVVEVHPNCGRQHFTYAGTDAERAAALWEYAHDDRLAILWCACGGYGATRLLPMLDGLTRERGVPPCKLLVGYSDVTALQQFVRRRWGWATLHAPMPASFDPAVLDGPTWQAIVAFVRGTRPELPWGARPLQFLNDAPSAPIEAELVGGNLSVWAAMAGTAERPGSAAGKLLFLEEVGEELYRIDRMVTQLAQAGMLDGVRGILLGDFTKCSDSVRMVRTNASDAPSRKTPLRPEFTLDAGLQEIFGSVGRRLGIPVARGLPVGHGPRFSPLPLGAAYRIAPDGAFELVQWGWLRE